MGDGIKRGGRDWGPDNPPPKSPGRPSMTPEVKLARKLNRAELDRILTEIMSLPKEELTEIWKNPKTISLRAAAAKILLMAIEKGDQQRLDFMFSRTVGKVKDEVDITVHPKPTIIEYPDGSVTLLGTELESDDREE